VSELPSSQVGEGIADDIRKQFHLSHPVDLVSLATTLGVVSLERKTMAEDGRLSWVDGLPRIDINSDRPATRQRFTLAHEIAHLVLESSSYESVYRSHAQHDKTERMCDSIAAALLMPREWVRFECGQGDGSVSLRLIRRIAIGAETSMSAAASRVNQVTGKTCCLLRWGKSTNAWTCLFRAGLPFELSSMQATLTLEASDILDRLDISVTVWRRIVVVFGNDYYQAHAQISRDTRGCLMLLRELAPVNL